MGIGVLAGGVEYIDEPALVLMLGNLPVGQWRYLQPHEKF